jgi:hypothetical protein
MHPIDLAPKTVTEAVVVFGAAAGVIAHIRGPEDKLRGSINADSAQRSHQVHHST